MELQGFNITHNIRTSEEDANKLTLIVSKKIHSDLVKLPTRVMVQPSAKGKELLQVKNMT